MNRDNYFFGFILGGIIPILGVLMVYVIRYMGKDISLEQFWRLLQDNPRAISSTLSLGMIACIPLFTFFRNRRLYKTLYGTFAATAIYAIIVVLYRFNLV